MQHVKTAVTLVLVGKGPDEQALRDQVERLGLQQRVRFEIDVTDERLYQLYEEALAVYYGPFDEDYGYVTLEGFAADRPVVTLADSGGPLEFVADGETGLVAAPEPKAIAEAFDRLFADRDAGGATGRGRQRARPRRGPALARRRRAVARLMLRDIARTLRRRAAPAAPGSVGELVFSGPLPPARTGVATYDRAVLDGLRRIGFFDRHRMDVLWPIEPKDTPRLPGLPPRGVRARQQRRVPPGGVPRRVPRARRR